MTLNGDNRDDPRWLFTPERLSQTPSIKLGMSEQEELTQRQQTASLIRQIGTELRERCKRPSGLCMDTAMVFMHRFYVFHSFQKYPPQKIAPCALFLAAKCEETPIKLEYVIRTTYMMLYPSVKEPPPRDLERLSQELIANENLLLQTLGFELIIYHPHTSVITCGDMVGAPKTVTKLAYELATNSLHFTTMCLKYKPTTVACVCLYIAFKRFNLLIPRSREGKNWWNYLDPNLEEEIIGDITKEFVAIIDKCRKAFNKWVSVRPQQPERNESKPVGGTSSTISSNSTIIQRHPTTSSSSSARPTQQH